MKGQVILVLLFGIASISCSGEISTHSVQMTPTPSEILPPPTTTQLQPTGTAALRDANRPPRTIKGGPLCENYVLAKIAALKTRGSQLVKLKGFNTQNEIISPDLKKWLETADPEKLVSFELKSGEKKALILGSRNIRSTGLASNFESWVIEIDGHSIEFQSLSYDPRLIFWDKNGSLNYYVVDFSSEFIEERDFDHPSLDLKRFVINNDSKSQLVSEERNVKCK